MVQILVTPDGEKSKTVDIKLEGKKDETLAELAMVLTDICKRLDPADRFALLMTVVQKSKPEV